MSRGYLRWLLKRRGSALEITAHDEAENAGKKPTIRQNNILESIADGDPEDKVEYYSTVFVAFWPCSRDPQTEGRYPRPYIDKVDFDTGDRIVYSPYSLRINNGTGAVNAIATRIDPRQKLTVSFLSEVIPDPRAGFLIHGHRYVCSSITATFTLRGLSTLLKATFYPIIS